MVIPDEHRADPIGNYYRDSDLQPIRIIYNNDCCSIIIPPSPGSGGIISKNWKYLKKLYPVRKFTIY